MTWQAMNGKLFFCFNLQLVKRLHHLRHLQLLVQVLKASAISTFLWLFCPRLRKGVGTEKNFNLWQESPVTKSINVIGHVVTSFEHHSITCLSMMISSGLGLQGIKTAPRACVWGDFRVMKSFVLMYDDAWLTSSDLLLRFGFYEILWGYAYAA